MGKDSIDKFTRMGFHTWQSKIKGYLMKKHLWSIVNPLGENERMETRASMARFQEKDEQAFGILLTSLDDNYVHYLDNCTSAYLAWTALERHFGTGAKQSKITLKMQLYELTMQPNEDIASLVNKLKSIATQLSYVKANIDEEDLVAILLKAMPEDPFEQIVIVLKEKDPSPSLENVINSL